MTDITLPGTRQTPAVDFRFSEGRLSLSGEAYPENASLFFDPLTAALQAHVDAGAATPITVQLDLRYLNSASTKLVFRLVGVLDRAAAAGRPVSLRFSVHPDDEMLRDLGDDMKTDFTWIDFEFVETV